MVSVTTRLAKLSSESLARLEDTTRKRTRCDTTTRRAVEERRCPWWSHGKRHEDVCSLISPVSVITRPQESARRSVFLALSTVNLAVGAGLVVGPTPARAAVSLNLDRRDVVKRLGDALFQEPLERIDLNRNQIGQLEGLLEIAERIAVPGYGARRHEYSSEGVQTYGPDPDARSALVRGSAGARARVTGENRETEKLRNAKRERAGTATREHNPGPGIATPMSAR